MTREEALRRAESALYGTPRMELPKDHGTVRKVADEIERVERETAERILSELAATKKRVWVPCGMDGFSEVDGAVPMWAFVKLRREFGLDGKATAPKEKPYMQGFVNVPTSELVAQYDQRIAALEAQLADARDAIERYKSLAEYHETAYQKLQHESEAELAAMRAERDSLQMQYGIVVQTLYDIAEIVEADKQRADGDELIARVKAAQADSRRLDWLQRNRLIISIVLRYVSGHFDVRRAIDTAMAAQNTVDLNNVLRDAAMNAEHPTPGPPA